MTKNAKLQFACKCPRDALQNGLAFVFAFCVALFVHGLLRAMAAHAAFTGALSRLHACASNRDGVCCLACFPNGRRCQFFGNLK